MIDPNKVIRDCEQADQIIEDQREEIARLKEAIRRLADQDATLSVCDGSVTVTMDATLTRGERRALEFAIGAYPLDDSIPATLRALLARLK
jgi:cell division septum initiation protein DivIVA